MSISITNRLHHLVGGAIDIARDRAAGAVETAQRKLASPETDSKPQSRHRHEGMIFDRLHRKYQKQQEVFTKETPELHLGVDSKHQPHDDHMTGMNTCEVGQYGRIARLMYNCIQKTLPAMFNRLPHGHKSPGPLPPAPGHQRGMPPAKQGKPEDPAHQLHGKKGNPPVQSKPLEEAFPPSTRAKRGDPGVKAGK